MTNSETTLKVERVKLGDVLYVIEQKKAWLNELIKEREKEQLDFKNEANTHMADYCQGRIDAYNFTIQELDQTYNLIKLFN